MSIVNEKWSDVRKVVDACECGVDRGESASQDYRDSALERAIRGSLVCWSVSTLVGTPTSTSKFMEAQPRPTAHLPTIAPIERAVPRARKSGYEEVDTSPLAPWRGSMPKLGRSACCLLVLSAVSLPVLGCCSHVFRKLPSWVASPTLLPGRRSNMALWPLPHWLFF